VKPTPAGFETVKPPVVSAASALKK